MEQRKYGRLPYSTTLLGMGCLRVPQDKQPDGSVKIRREEATVLVRRAIDKGINYVDTAALYQDGDNEAFLGEALKDGYRERVKLVTKLPLWLCETEADVDRMFEESLKRLQTDYVDVYLLHSMNKSYWGLAKKFHALEHLDRWRKEGRIKAAGFSFHDGYGLLKEMIGAYDWDMCQIQLNLLDTYNQATVEGLKYAHGKGLAVVIMEPLRGGRLFNLPPAAKKLVNEHPSGRSIIEWAFRYLYDMPEITTILSGMSTVEQLDENLAIFENARAGVMTEEDQAFIAKLREAIESAMMVGCTGCRYCQPCPRGVLIPDIFAKWNNLAAFGGRPKLAGQYAGMLKAGEGADRCVACGACESHCPQDIPIIQKLQEAHQELTKPVD